MGRVETRFALRNFNHPHTHSQSSIRYFTVEGRVFASMVLFFHSTHTHNIHHCVNTTRSKTTDFMDLFAPPRTTEYNLIWHYIDSSDDNSNRRIITIIITGTYKTSSCTTYQTVMWRIICSTINVGINNIIICECIDIVIVFAVSRDVVYSF